MKNFRRHKSKSSTTRADGERERREPRTDERRGDESRRNEPRRAEARAGEPRRAEGRATETPRNEPRRHEARGSEARDTEARRHEARGSEARRHEAGRHETRGNEVRADDGRGGTGKRVERPADESQLYGVLPVLEALRAGHRRIERITIAEGAGGTRLHELFELAHEFRVPVRRAPRVELQRMAVAGANHQGVVAQVAAVAYAEADELMDVVAARVGTDEPPLAVVLDGVEDPRNLGAIIRTAECAGVHGLFVPERRAVGLTETVAKASAGALEYLPIARATNIARLVEEFKERGIWTVGTDAETNIAYTDWDWTQPCALLLGGEGAGLRRLVRERCDALVGIPLRGRISSLNVSVAAAVVLYEALRQRTATPSATYEEKPEGGE